MTPYDTTHLGHARTFLVFDVLTRILEAEGHRVRYAQNVTDVDESILQRAARDGIDWRTLGRREERAFLEDMRQLGWRKPDIICHATQEIPAMIRLARRLRARGHAYDLPGGLYYDVSTFSRFGELSKLAPAQMTRILAQQDDARLDDPRRKSARDFALWRRVPDGPTWPGPFGRGRPGWHLECSAMSEHHLGYPIDIHGGGSDLAFPHHECEIAQSEGAHPGRVRFARHWVHVAPMRLSGRKMSKSDGNMVFVRDALRRVSPHALRLYLLDVHYRSPFDHDEARLSRAAERATALAEALRGRPGLLARDAASREVMDALKDDLRTDRAVRALERAAPHARGAAASSLRTIARRILGVV